MTLWNFDRPRGDGRILTVDGVDITEHLKVASSESGVPEVEILAAAYAVSGCRASHERWGRQTAEAQQAIFLKDIDALGAVAIANRGGITFGIAADMPTSWHSLEALGLARENSIRDTQGGLIRLGLRMDLAILTVVTLRGSDRHSLRLHAALALLWGTPPSDALRGEGRERARYALARARMAYRLSLQV